VFPQSNASIGNSQKKGVSEARIEFVRYGKRPSIYTDESDERVWLRVINQSAKETLTFDAEDSQRTLDFVRRKSKELDMYYETVTKEDSASEDEIVAERPVGYTRREAYNIVALKPGQSFIFSVARQHLSKGRAIYIVYYFDKKKAASAEDGDLRKTYYFASQLPNGRPVQRRPSKQP
jgi:hypothetical protein